MFNRTKQVLSALKEKCGLDAVPTSSAGYIFNVGGKRAIVRSSKLLNATRKYQDRKYQYKLWDVNLLYMGPHKVDIFYIGLFDRNELLGIVKYTARDAGTNSHMAIMRNRLPALACGQFVYTSPTLN